MTGMVPVWFDGELGGAAKRHLGAIGLGNGGDLVIIGGDDHPRKAAAGQRRLDRPGDHRLAGKLANILARNTLAAAAGGDDGNHHSILTGTIFGGENGRPQALIRFFSKYDLWEGIHLENK